MMSMSSCTRYLVYGNYEDYNEPIIGNVNHNLMIGGGDFEMTIINKNIVCKGKFSPPDKIPNIFACKGQEGSGYLLCADGNEINLRWFAESCKGGTANGKDSFNKKIILYFDFNISDEDALKKLEIQSDSIKNKPSQINEYAENYCLEKGFDKESDEFKYCVLENVQD
jgi:hypothetical protein